MATSSPLGDVTDIFSKLLPIFAGTGKTLSTESGSPQANADTQNVIDQATANANNPALTDQLVQNIMRQASESFAPVVAQQQAGGMYNTSTLNLLKNDAMSRATAQSAKAVLDYRTSQQQIAEAASGKLLSANQSKVSRTAASPAATPLALIGAGLSGTRLLNNLGALDPLKSAAKSGYNSLFGPEQTAGGYNVPGMNGAPPVKPDVAVAGNDAGGVDASASFDPTYSDPGGALSDTGGGIGTGFGAGGGASGTAATQAINIGDAAANGFGDTATNLASSGALDASGALLTSGSDTAEAAFGEAGTSAGGDVAAIGGDTATGAVGSAESSGAAGEAGFSAANGASFGGESTAAGAESGIPIAASLGGDAVTAASGNSDAGEAVTLAADVATGGILPAISSAVGSIICTELKKQTKLSMKLWIMCGKEYAKYPDIIKRGYYFYAIPAVRHMRKYPDGKLSRLLERLLKCRANWVAAKYGTYGATKTVGGFCIFHGLNIVGRITGFFVREMPDWQSVYRTQPQEQH